MKTTEFLNIYRQMYKSRIFEEHVVQIWKDGLDPKKLLLEFLGHKKVISHTSVSVTFIK